MLTYFLNPQATVAPLLQTFKEKLTVNHPFHTHPRQEANAQAICICDVFYLSSKRKVYGFTEIFIGNITYTPPPSFDLYLLSFSPCDCKHAHAGCSNDVNSLLHLHKGQRTRTFLTFLLLLPVLPPAKTGVNLCPRHNIRQ